MKFGRRNFLKGLGSLAAAWMVKPKLPKLEEPPEKEIETKEKKENDDVEQMCYDLKLTFYDEDEKWPVSCNACDRYACVKGCPRHAISPYRHHFTYGDTFRSLEEQQERRARLKENVRRRSEENE